MKQLFSKLAVVFLLVPVLTFLISGTVSAQRTTTHHQAVPIAVDCPPTIGPGSKSPAVLILERVFKLPVDGIFGPLLEAKVKEFQRQNHLPVTGIVGPATWHALHQC